MKRGVFFLLIALPVASVLMGAITFYIAFSDPDPVVEQSERVLGKTSWQRGTSQRATPPEVGAQ